MSIRNSVKNEEIFHPSFKGSLHVLISSMNFLFYLQYVYNYFDVYILNFYVDNCLVYLKCS